MIGPKNLARERGTKAERLCPNFIPTLFVFFKQEHNKLKTHDHDPLQVGDAISESTRRPPADQQHHQASARQLIVLGTASHPNALQQMDTLRYNLCTHHITG